jgi:hypothetical protein
MQATVERSELEAPASTRMPTERTTDTPAQLARKWGVSYKTVMRWIDNRELDAANLARTPGCKRLAIARAESNRFWELRCKNQTAHCAGPARTCHRRSRAVRYEGAKYA